MELNSTLHHTRTSVSALRLLILFVGLTLLTVTSKGNSANDYGNNHSRVTANENAAVVQDATINKTASITCYGGSDGELTASFPGGVAPFSYQWANGENTATISGLEAGTYSVTIIDGGGQEAQGEYELGQPQALEVNFNVTPATTCASDGDGALTASAIGGTGLYNYLWGTGEAAQTIQNKSQGEYYVEVTDQNGCTAQAVVSVTVNDQTKPIAAAHDVTAFLDENGEAELSPEDLDEGSQDDCGIDSYEVLGGSFTCSDVGASGLTASLRVADAAGNDSTAQANVTVLDTLKPVISRQTVTVFLDENGNASINPVMVDNGSTDNCSIVQYGLSTTEFSCENLGINPEMFTITDGSGNESSIETDILVKDDMAPVVEVEDTQVALGQSGTASISVDDLEMEYSDNCAVTQLKLNNKNFDCSDIGNVEVEITAADASGNTGTDVFIVEVVDNGAPVIDCPGTITMCEGELSFEGISLTDNCQAILQSVGGPAEGDFLSEGEYQAELQATDLAGNTANCSVPIVVKHTPEVDLGGSFEAELGTVVTLSAGTDNGNSYQWSTGETTPEIEFFVTGSVEIGVDVTASTGCQASDSLVIEAYAPSGLAETHDSHSMKLSPNPVNSQLNVSFHLQAAQDDVQMTIIDFQGRVVKTRNFNRIAHNGSLVIDLGQLAAGAYMVDFRSNQLHHTQQIIKR